MDAIYKQFIVQTLRRYLQVTIFFFSGILIAGASTIHVNAEGWGTVKKNTGETGSKGSMFWNGHEWTTNETSLHMYFTYLETGQRIKTPINIDISARTLTSSSFDTLGYHFIRKNYTYSDRAKQGGSYKYEAIQYQIEPSEGRKIVLRSRGTGNGIEKRYFNIYIEDSVNYITALRNDPQWFTYKGMSMDSALQQNSATQFLTGSLSSANGYYFMDINGGADMAGLSYIFHTDSLKDSPKTDVLGSSFPVDFGFRCFAPDGGNIIEFRFLPKLVSETYMAPATLAVNATTLNMGYATGSTSTFSITSNTDWTINTGQSWLTANPPSGTGNANVVLTAQANKEPGNRSATVTVSASGVAAPTITVTQSLNTSLSVPEKDGIIVYPNPFIQGFHVSGIRGKTTLRLADRTGRVLMVRETGGDEYWDAGDLPAGLYMVKIITPLASREIKLVKK